MHVMELAAFLLLLAGAACSSAPVREAYVPAVAPAAPVESLSREARIARAKALELPTPYEQPPGDILGHHASALAKIMCSAIFITGLDPDFAEANVGYVPPFDARARIGKPVVDRAAKTVRVSTPNGQTRTAKYFGTPG